ncbi:hypothetical protein HJC02_24040 [Rhizobium sp. NLR4a]|uniref:hypothetical protein n=1 Tax=Rhizobium sp. NLR4a TaxID=2731117 RepID=UPI001C82C82C|nr:hypothetical protein [Rhizobium sp. NLR4a]MBX5235310.1 hypothetical protein [Rhizobium sp. NLR4a]
MSNTNITVIDEETRRQRIAQAWHYMVPIDLMPLEEMNAALGMVAYSIINAISVEELGHLGRSMLVYGDSRAREAMSLFDEE